MSKTNTEKMAPETQTPEMANGMKLDVRVRPIAPMGNLLAFANVTIGGCFKIDGFRICSSEKGLYVNMPATQDKGGNWKDVCWPVTAEFRKQLNDALIDGYGQAIENLQATLEATKGAAEKPSLTGALKENAGKVKEQPTNISSVFRKRHRRRNRQRRRKRVWIANRRKHPSWNLLRMNYRRRQRIKSSPMQDGRRNGLHKKQSRRKIVYLPGRNCAWRRFPTRRPEKPKNT